MLFLTVSATGSSPLTFTACFGIANRVCFPPCCLPELRGSHQTAGRPGSSVDARTQFNDPRRPLSALRADTDRPGPSSQSAMPAAPAAPVATSSAQAVCPERSASRQTAPNKGPMQTRRPQAPRTLARVHPPAIPPQPPDPKAGASTTKSDVMPTRRAALG
jgi:hypothetical protein